MNKVKVLTEDIISKIAAGEVIESPASVVKELIENAIDAKADSIEVELTQAGKKRILIKDTGLGINNEDIEKVFLRHSTSKINAVADLFNINSLGFRGEALYSIASIADVNLQSKTKNEDCGQQIHIRGLRTLQKKPFNMVKGTTVDVQELFFNTPARKKFLKSDTTELTKIVKVFTPYTILYPNLKFLLKNNNRTIIDVKPAVNTLERISQVLRVKKEHLIKIEKNFPDDDISIRCILADINIQRAKKDMQFIFVNNRPVQNKMISFHLNNVYSSILAPKVFPLFAVFININPNQVDANSHPTKKEVKIKDESLICGILRKICQDALTNQTMPKQINEQRYYHLNDKNDYDKKALMQTQPTNSFYQAGTNKTDEQFSFLETTANDNSSLKGLLKNSVYIGSFLNKYLLFECRSSILCIDQHAADERINFEKLIKQIKKNSVEIQHLLSPALLQLNSHEFIIWEKLNKKLEKIGFSTTLFNEDTIAIHSYPILLKNIEHCVRNILSEENIEKFDKETIARTACRKSFMFKDKLNPVQAKKLKEDLLKTDVPFTCPHGRPTIIEIPESFLSRQFLR